MPTHNDKFPKSLLYLKKEERDAVNFFVQININVFYNLILSYLTGVVRHVESTQNNKHVISL